MCKIIRLNSPDFENSSYTLSVISEFGNAMFYA